MLAFNGMLFTSAEKAGIKVPEDCDEYNAEEFPHWHVFCMLQIGRAMPSMMMLFNLDSFNENY